MRLAIGCASLHRGADAGRDRGVQEIDVEAEMQHAVARSDPFYHPADQHADAEFVDRAHIGDCDASIAHENLFQRINRANAEQLKLVWRDGNAWQAAEQAVTAGFAAEEG